MSKRILFTGGGTAGHVMVNVALIPELIKKEWDIQYIGSQNGIEKLLITGVPYHSISTGKLRRYWDWNNLKDPFKILKGCLQSYKLIKKMKPDIVFSAGGFVSVPVVIGARLNKVPIIIREPDSTLGLANKIALPFATKICTTFPDTEKNLNSEKTTYIGPIVREEILRGNRLRGKAFCGFQLNKPMILIMGGSQGAQWINDMVRNSLDILLMEFNVVHICGKGKENSSIKMKGYKQFEYIGEELPDMLQLASIVVSRAGSSAISELLTLKKPTLLIPLTSGSSRGDQIINAKYFERSGYAEVLLQEDTTHDTFIHAIKKVYNNKEKYIQNMNDSNMGNNEGLLQLINLISETCKPN
ncbi:undecaprenyldiphospho-muramoylpentapeptide beta-N-acetylglucosaminyltransferase [Bacillus cereus]|uniref:undecaprenyldiphospho-muramoylpentapeptide beta-N-acetylglucosaminyltransferase n=1 Tax=Bacillus cereus TaxID=1396 RepID=UPI000BFDEFB3|nr:undecaprenyldiphospho-muramoylpentapeptide beta-N-acetylglucosaminyltransferase [Bacillus cereus]PGU00197.1 undecaprenyldiphospho-muramoylpentapeptide beta-N-acetylglucosaminyltransferase [Bacillus cereus]